MNHADESPKKDSGKFSFHCFRVQWRLSDPDDSRSFLLSSDFLDLDLENISGERVEYVVKLRCDG